MPVELCVIIPTLNEASNVPAIIERLAHVLAGVEWEAIFVDDDSADGTAELLRKIAFEDARIRVIHRIGRRGLASACIEGCLASAAPYLAIMDADLQHDESLLPAMLRAVRGGQFDLAIGSRYVPGGSVGEWRRWRRWASQMSTRVARGILPCKLSDPMSGFLVMSSALFLAAVRRMSGVGFKFLLDLVVSSPRTPRHIDFPYVFRQRAAGSSKLSTRVVLEYFQLIIEKKLPSFVPLRFGLFVFVGVFGAIGHLALFVFLYRYAGWQFFSSQATAAVCAMTMNFTFNNTFTYREVALRGWRFIRGLVGFYMICSLGAYLNVQIAETLKDSGVLFWVASLVGGMVGGLWNYSVSSVWTWAPKRQR